MKESLLVIGFAALLILGISWSIKNDAHDFHVCRTQGYSWFHCYNSTWGSHN
jgi:hypothetical protein